MAWKLLKDLLYFVPVGIPKGWTEIKELDPSKPIVVLVSGFGASPSSLRIIRKRLIQDGFNVILQTLSYQDLSDSVSGFPWLAEKLSRLIKDLRDRVGTKEQKIFIVAHSAGGLVARYYVQQLEGYRYLDGLVTLATPHKGLWLAGLGFFTHLVVKAKCLYDILPVSQFVRSLNSAEFPKSFDMVSIYSTQDVLCPVETTQLPPNIYQSGKVKQYEITDISHMEFLYKKKAYLYLRQWLQEHLRSELQSVNKNTVTR